MKITNLSIKNFKAIKNIQFNELNNTVLIAGQNGCGKSCIFHSIRLLKSVIGGYQDNEWHMWFNEFQIKPQNMRHQITKLFQTETRDLKISAVFELSKDEKKFLEKDGKEMLEYRMWKKQVPGLANRHYRDRPLGAEYQDLAKQISGLCAPQFEVLKQELKQKNFQAKFEANRLGEIKTSADLPLQLAFSVYGEEEIGIVDYHGPHRDYQREELGNINLNIQTSKQSMKQHSLYNYSNKYKNVKQEMAGNYIRKLLQEKAGESENRENDLIDTLKELFNEFFPGKEFLGPVPNSEGGIDFPVKLSNGKTHDINDLSSGEKEVLYGYLRLRYSAPKNSIIMLDEPELHLNPRLITGLPRFYKKHLGEKLNNQLWLVTHSDEFLRQAVNENDFQVYHLQESGNLPYQNNQIKMIDASDDLEMAVIDLVGDLATYAPHKKIVLLEGENSEFDLKMISRLFPEFRENVNLISVGSKVKVKKLHELLARANQKAELKAKYYSITDKDDEVLGESNNPAESYTWEVYHIENYLLEEDYILKAIQSMTLEEGTTSIEEIKQSLIESARECLPKLISHKLRQKAYNSTFATIDLGTSPQDTEIAKSTFEALERNIERISKYSSEEFKKKLETIESDERAGFEDSVTSGEWKQNAKGRDVLKSFAASLHPKVSYEVLRNSIISHMASESFKPEGMESIINKIIES